MSNKLDSMRYAGKVNQAAIEWGFHTAKPGITLVDVDRAVEWYIRSAGCRPAFKNYKPDMPGILTPFPGSACLSPNDVMVHGIPNDYILKPGDLLTIDVGTEYENWFVDSARTRIIEGKNELGSKLIEATEEILKAQLAVVKDGCDMLTIVLAAEKIARQYGAKIFSIWGGHGIGDKVHTEPFIPNAFTEGQSHLARCFEENNFKLSRFHAGHTYCIEPVVTFGSLDMIVDPDGWTVRHKDGQLVAHTERTILVLENGIEVLS